MEKYTKDLSLAGTGINTVLMMVLFFSLKKKIDELNDRLNTLQENSTKMNKLVYQSRMYKTQSESAMDTINEELMTIKQQIESLESGLDLTKSSLEKINTIEPKKQENKYSKSKKLGKMLPKIKLPENLIDLSMNEEEKKIPAASKSVMVEENMEEIEDYDS